MFYADAAAASGDRDEVRHALALAEPVIEAGERWFEAEYLRLRAWLAAGKQAALADLEEALAIAQAQGADALATRAVTALDRLSNA